MIIIFTMILPFILGRGATMIRFKYAKPLFFVAALSAAVLANSASKADLVGTSVTGGFFAAGGPTNYFDPVNGHVPAGFSNTAGTTVTVVNPGVELAIRTWLILSPWILPVARSSLLMS